MIRPGKKNYIELIEAIRHELDSLFNLNIRLGAELEFYLEANNIGSLESVLKECASNGLRIDKEKGRHQFEWVTDVFTDPLLIIKQIIDTKKLITRIAEKYEARAVFFAKPLKEDYGSALHIHLSLHDSSGDNKYSSGRIEDNELLMHSIAGLLDISAESLVLLCKSQQAFERFTPRFMSPTFIAWGGNNRTTIVRIPDVPLIFRRIEYRLAPADADPFALVFLCFLGILNGLTNKMLPPERVFGNAFDPQYKLEALPSSLDQAKKIFYNRAKVANFIHKTLKY